MRRLSAMVAAVALLVSACAIPADRGASKPAKQAAEQADVDAIFDRYRAVRNAAAGLLDPKPLSTVESGPVLAIDTGSFEVSQRLSTTQDEESEQLVVTDVQTPSFSKYPLWFMATAFDPGGKVNRVQIFQRDSAVDPWLLVAAPQTVVSTELPELRHDGNGAALTVAPSSSTGMAMSPQEAAEAYARALGSTTPSTEVAQDDFIRQMRDSFDANSSLEGVGVTQDWAAEKVVHALRTDDGGALVFRDPAAPRRVRGPARGHGVLARGLAAGGLPRRGHLFHGQAPLLPPGPAVPSRRRRASASAGPVRRRRGRRR